MRFVLFLILLATLVVGLGLFMGWFHFSSRAGTGQPNVTLTVDTAKFDADKDKVIGSMQGTATETVDTIKEPRAKGNVTTSPTIAD